MQVLYREASHSLSISVAVSDTTRPPRSGEVNGRRYFFIRRSQMERDILNGEMVEHALHEGHYYATSVNSIRRVVNSGRTCLLVLDPQAIKLVRNGEIRPFIVYFNSPTAEFMRKNWGPTRKIKVREGGREGGRECEREWREGGKEWREWREGGRGGGRERGGRVGKRREGRREEGWDGGGREGGREGREGGEKERRENPHPFLTGVSCSRHRQTSHSLGEELWPLL